MRILKEQPGASGDRIEYAFQLCAGRAPSSREKERLSQYLDQQIGIFKKDTAAASALLPLTPEGLDPVESAAWVGVSRVLLNLDEFITRE
jgi:hypothetical protein